MDFLTALCPPNKSLTVKVSCPRAPVGPTWPEELDAIGANPVDLKMSSHDAKPSDFWDEISSSLLLAPSLDAFGINVPAGKISGY